MRVSEQIDALEIMGINSKAYLIMPKVAATVITIPMLVILSMALGIWGGRLAGSISGILSTAVYDEGLVLGFVPYNVLFAMYKAVTFAFIISTIPAYYGYHVKGGALEIGRSSTKSVVVSCVMILFADYILAAIFLPKA
jgi:phospholipid/cholesterol/gamma-HCH transport system permease protein